MDLIISIDRFRELTGVYDTMDENLIAPHIEIATDVLTEEVLGTALTNKLITDFNADTLTGLYETVYPYVEKMVVFQAFKFGLVSWLIQVSNGKITKGSTLDSSPIELSELAALERRQDAKIVRYTNQVKKFLADNFNDIPELKVDTVPYLKPDTGEVNTAQGLSSTPNILYNNF